ncbi:MAG: hypothetical protein Q7T87_19480, partial [Polaromonas sp.]|nr:hypothetical protein [Polaromonas sp.]
PVALTTVRPVGTTSVTVTLVAALGPALLITIAKLIVAPAPVPFGVLAVFVTERSAIATTLKAAVAGSALVPTDVVKEPEGMVLVNVPATELVTMALITQLPAGGMTELDARVNVPRPAVALTTPDAQLFAGDGLAALTSPTG